MQIISYYGQLMVGVISSNIGQPITTSSSFISKWKSEFRKDKGWPRMGVSSQIEKYFNSLETSLLLNI